MNKITSVIPTYNNLPFLKLTVTSVRQNCYYNDMPIFIFAENCTDGTNEWLAENADELGIEYYIETGNEEQRGIGGGIDLCVSKVRTEFVNILHSDFWVGPNQDIELLKLYEEFPNDRLIASSFNSFLIFLTIMTLIKIFIASCVSLSIFLNTFSIFLFTIYSA